MDKLRGLVLSGGESRRMGRDKGLLVSDTLPWVNRAGGLLQQAGLPVHVMVREAQRQSYAEVLLVDFEILTDRPLPVHGPLRGLLSFHRRYPHSDVLVLPCDMPACTPELLSELIDSYRSHPLYDAWVFADAERLQPLPGIYAAGHLAGIWQQLQSGILPESSLMYVLRAGKTARKQLTDALLPAMRNVNRPEDL